MVVSVRLEAEKTEENRVRMGLGRRVGSSCFQLAKWGKEQNPGFYLIGAWAVEWTLDPEFCFSPINFEVPMKP